MKKLNFKFGLVIAISFFLLTSCAFHSGYVLNSASLSSANFKYVKQNVKGTSTASYILGFGGLAKETLVAEAKQKMVATSPLRANQALANISVNFKASYIYVFYITTTCTVTADIVEFK